MRTVREFSQSYSKSISQKNPCIEKASIFLWSLSFQGGSWV
ncbi:hypothetical protein LEP1GSC059_0498 [Leptospira noguchii serovar Panama str. CZ214]|uniref:Uncharacterized protein n=1 Tax=Leptospira noguchii serovar Panama str. CZ214 TaxID=1001595 RepID=T0FT02_9LEPT|nr:hypothetical protein LEP1GSC059_0498 [Leptospira noguchii serovar Panama str. CZ214]